MELDKAYEPQKHEADIYKLWEESGAFQPDLKSTKEPFSIIMPPPNANGDLHVGHAMYVIEDILTRYYRMKGHPTLWLPGADHAGIETQVVYERELEKQGRSRFDLGPEKFYDEIMNFTMNNMKSMTSQIRRLGFGVDWTRFKFTLDDDVIATVYDTFKKLHDDGLIYRGNRIVNWCTRCLSSFADIEVKYEDREDHMYTLDYGNVKIATTRPETIFADVAVAVNPKDPRYTKLIGKTATVPLVNRPIPVIADDHVDPKTGTGALKVTPGHSADDFEIGLRHDLAQISVVDLEGRMINVPEELLGLEVAPARQKSVEMLKTAGALLDTKPLRHSVGTHGRCGTVIEPLITEQWWLKVDELVKPAIKAIKSGEVKIVPNRFTKTALSWLENLYDWNISRQNWWGIRIPVFYKTSNDPSKDLYIIGDEAEAKKYYGADNYRTESDTFDTWFSSGQWPFASLGYPSSPDFKRFYPTSVMETGRDILFLWVTRMLMMGLYRTGKVPFKTVYLHGMVNDAHGKKMSKSRGNVINPLVMTDKFGTDALRLALTIGITPGNDGTLSEEKIEGYRNFANKLWNVARFILAQTPGDYSPTAPEAKSLADKWILDRIAKATANVTKNIEEYRFGDAGQAVYSLLWDDFADWYIEASKAETNLDVLVYGLEAILKLTHPFAPFVTEAIWQKMPWQKQNLVISSWPEPGYHFSEAKNFDVIRELVSNIRNLKAELGLKQVTLLYANEPTIADNELLLERLGGVTKFQAVERGRGLALPGTLRVWLDIDDEAVKSYAKQLRSQRNERADYVAKLEKQLKNAGYIKSAPSQIVQDTRDRLEQAKVLLSRLDEQLEGITKK